MIAIESPPWGMALAVCTRKEGRQDVHDPNRSIEWVQFTLRREVVCGVKKVVRAHTEKKLRTRIKGLCAVRLLTFFANEKYKLD